jgi:hypothetical protein
MENNRLNRVLVRNMAKAEAERATFRTKFFQNFDERAANPEAGVIQSLNARSLPDNDASPSANGPPFPGKFANRGVKRHSSYSPPNNLPPLHPKATANNVMKSKNKLINNHLRKLAENPFGDSSMTRAVPTQVRLYIFSCDVVFERRP